MIFSACLSWIPVICNKLVNMFIPRPQCEFLPEDVIAEILSRLPAKCVHQCRRVCKQWNSLISTSSFNEMYIKRAIPTLILYKCSGFENELIFVAEWEDLSKKTKPKTKKINASDILSAEFKPSTTLSTFSYNGFLVFSEPRLKPPYTKIIYNPFTQNKITLHSHCQGEICGVFFHPISREYCLLWLQSLDELWQKKKRMEFMMLCLGSQPYWRKLSNFIYRPQTSEPPVNLYEALHWISSGFYADGRQCNSAPCSQSITIFSIEKEEFRVMPHPGGISECSSGWWSHYQLHLFSLEGHLALCKISGVLEIWILEDYASWFWTKMRNVKFELDFLAIGRKPVADVLGIQNGALIIHLLYIGLFAYHLQTKTVKKFIFETDPRSRITPCLHTKSLFSLRESQPVEIFMD